MKKVYLILLIVSSVIIVLIALCFFNIIGPNLPIYELTKDDGYNVVIDEVRYKQLPALKWQIDPSIHGKVIGYASDRSAVIWLEETEGNFIYLKGQWADYYDTLYRTDINIPDPSADSVDKIVWDDYIVEDSEIKDEYTNTVEDEEIIAELFNLLDSGEKTDNFDGIKNESGSIIMNIRLYCADLPGVYYGLSVGLDNGRIVCGRPLTGYVYMPDDMLEKIAGKKIDIEKLIN